MSHVLKKTNKKKHYAPNKSMHLVLIALDKSFCQMKWNVKLIVPRGILCKQNTFKDQIQCVPGSLFSELITTPPQNHVREGRLTMRLERNVFLQTNKLFQLASYLVEHVSALLRVPSACLAHTLFLHPSWASSSRRWEGVDTVEP